MNHIVAFVYYNGRKFEGDEGLTFEGQKRTMQLKRKMSMDSLKKRIHSKLKLECNQVISSVTYRFLMSQNPKYFSGVQLFDDEDVACVINAFVQQSFMNAMELYIDIDEVGSSSVPIPTYSMITPQTLTGEDVRPVDESFDGPAHDNVDTTINLGEDGDDDNDYHVDADAYLSEDVNESEDGQIPDGDSSDTDVEGDFNANEQQQIAPTPPIPTMAHTPPISQMAYATQIGSAVPVNTYPASQDANDVPFWSSSSYYTYIDWNHPDQETDFPDLDEGGTWQIGQDLYVGQRFENKQAVQQALKHYSMKIHQSFRVVESTPTLLNVKCPNSKDDSPCPWRMRAYLSKNSNTWKVTKWGGPHTCVNHMITQDHNKCDSEFISSCILGMVSEAPNITISLIQERITGMFGYTVSYRKAWKAKQKALKKVFGDWDESYDLLPRWLEYMLMPNSPGSYYIVATEPAGTHGVVDNRFRIFRRVFWTFKQCAQAFDYCKPMIQIDGTFLYGKYTGTLLIATAQDGNSHVLPIAFAIVEGETFGAWSWFLKLIRLHVTSKQGICLISDRHQSIKSAVLAAPEWQPPYAYHVFCIRHIASNFNHTFKNTKLKQELISLGYEPCPYYFEKKLAKFRDDNTEIVRQWIDNIPKETWSLACDVSGCRFGHMTTNLSECVNKVLKGARNLPITSLVKFTYTRLVEYFVKRVGRARAELAEGKVYCHNIMEKLQQNQARACAQRVLRFDHRRSRFEVQEPLNPVTQRGGMKWKVDLNNGFCECGRWKAYKYPCSHVIASCAHVAIDFYQFVDPVYSIENVAQAYEFEWFPIGNDLNMPPRVGPRIIPDPTTKRGKGRPKSTRIRNEMDLIETGPSQHRCSQCGQRGHNRARCPALHASVNSTINNLFDDDNL